MVRENKPVKQYLRNHAITVSQKTAERIDKDIQKILTKSETEGTNSRGVAKHITQKFKDLKTWEAERIARTEINAANNLVSHNRLLESGLVDYKQWLTAEDGRVRTSHKHMNGEIARIGEPFSNGLQYPGDHNGPLAEFINCRCTIIPYIPDYDKIAPTNKNTWHEEDMQRLPTSTGQQITLQLQETQKLYTVMEGYMKLYPDKITIKPGKIQTTLDKFFHTKPKSTLDKILQPLNKTKTTTIQNDEITQYNKLLKELEKQGINTTSKITPELLEEKTDWDLIKRMDILEQYDTYQEKQLYKKLLKKLTSNGGTIHIHKNRIIIEGKGLNFKEKRILKDLHAKQNNIKQNKVTKEDNTKAIQKQHKKKNKDLKEKQRKKENNIKQIQTKEKELHTKFRRENKKIAEKMDENNLIHGEHYHYVQDEKGNIYIEWFSKGSTNRKNSIDKFYNELVSNVELYEHESLESLFPGKQKQAIDAYTDDSFGPFNAMYRWTKQMKQMGKHREEIIDKFGQERWNKVLRFYKTKMQSEYKLFKKADGKLEYFFHTRVAYDNKSYKLKMNTRLYHGQDKWYGKKPKVGYKDTIGQYLSTSHDLDVADHYARKNGTPIEEQVIIEIDAPKCTKAMHIIDRGKDTRESEFLLRYDQEYEITKVFTGDDGRMHVRYKLLGEVC